MRYLLLLAFLPGLAIACSGAAEPEMTSTPSPAPSATAAPLPEIHGTPPEGSAGNQRPPSDRAPLAMHDTQDVLASGTELAFRVCSQEVGWQKPGPDAMTPVFQDRRFGDGIEPYPLEYTYYLRDFYFPQLYAASANKYWRGFSGFSVSPENPETFCDAQALRTQGLFRAIRTLDYEVTESRRLDNTLVIVVQRGFSGWQETVFPYPPEQPVFRGDGIEAVRVVDASGSTLFEEDTPISRVAWFQTLQDSEDGSLTFLTIGGILPYATSAITVPDGQPALVLYSSSPEVTDVPGSLVAYDAAGRKAGRIEWQGHHEMWQALGSLTLPAGTYTLRLDDDQHDWHHFALIAEGVPLPPGVNNGE